MAELGWLDLSKAYKTKITAVLDFLKPEGRVDELGIGIIRDSIADYLFPGISTIQTRAKYFYIVPYILQEYFKQKPAFRAKNSLEKFLENNEKEIMYRLGEAYNHEDGHGVIGITKRRGESLARYPSTIYWNGLQKFKFIEYNQYSFGAYLNAFKKVTEDLKSNVVEGDDSVNDDSDAGHENISGVKVKYKPNVAEISSLELEADEAEDFEYRIKIYQSNSLLAELITNEKLYNLFKLDNSGKERFVKFAEAAIHEIKSHELKEMICFAHDFSLVMSGAHIVYNQMIQEKIKSEYDFDEDWELWKEKISGGLLRPDLLTIENVMRISPRVSGRKGTLTFLKNWFELVLNNDLENKIRFKLIEEQEHINKKTKARLKLNKLDDCQEGVWIGFDYLDYRYNNVRTILNDIKSKL